MFSSGSLVRKCVCPLLSVKLEEMKCCVKPPVCLGGLSPDALRRWTVVTTVG